MLFLFHGENVVESRKALLELKRQYKAVDVLSLEALGDVEKLVGICGSQGMLSAVRLVIVEGQKRLMNQKEVLEYLGRKPDSTVVALWFGEKLPLNSPLLNLVKDTGGKVDYFEGVTKSIFPFLDALGLRERRKAFLELHELLTAGENPLSLLSMIVYQFRGILRVKCGPPQPKLHSFVRRKLNFQAEKFKLTELYEIYRQLLTLEKDVKSGRCNLLVELPRLVDSITGGFNASG